LVDLANVSGDLAKLLRQLRLNQELLLICLSVGSLLDSEKLALCILIVFLVLLILFAVVEVLVHASGVVDQILELLWVLIIHIWYCSLCGGGSGVHLVWHEHLLLCSFSIFGWVLRLRGEVADVWILILQSISELLSVGAILCLTIYKWYTLR